MIDEKKLAKEIAELKKNFTAGNVDYQTGYLCALSVAEGMIADQPKLPAFGEWVPVSERRPEEEEVDVLVSTKAFGVSIGLYTKRYGCGMQEGFLTNHGFVNMKNAEAWMSLPEPYKGE